MNHLQVSMGTGKKYSTATGKNARPFHWLVWLAVLSLIAISGFLRFYHIDALGYGNHYYAAAVKSMLQSWHNFFFVAAEPGGAVSVDKPPVGLWLQTISAYFFGVNAIGLLLPQILAGIGSVLLVFHLVRRSFGLVAGWVAGLTLAVVPVAVAVDRNNTIDSILIFFLLLAAWSFIKAAESGKLRFLLLGGFLVGVGFNVKMLEAYLPVPAFLLLYFCAAREKFWQRIGKLVLTGLMILIVSFSWALAVDLTPASARPYVGSSSDNSEMTLILGYNGVNRLIGMARGGMGGGRSGEAGRMEQPGGAGGDLPDKSAITSSREMGNTPAMNGGGQSSSSVNPGEKPSNRPNQNRTESGPSGENVQTAMSGSPGQAGRQSTPGGNGSPGGGTPSNIGTVGPLRLFQLPLAKEASWLLPFSLLGLLALMLGSRWSWPFDTRWQAVVLWGGWLLTAGIFFSVAKYFHEYYLVTIAPPLAALVGIAAAEGWRIICRHGWTAAIAFLAASAGTIAYQIMLVSGYNADAYWLPYLWLVFFIGMILILWQVVIENEANWLRTGFSLVLIALLITPAIWSFQTAQNPSSNSSLPAAYSGKNTAPKSHDSLSVNQTLIDYLQKNTQGVRYLMAVPSSMQGADYVLATGRPVLYLGGFKGSDQVLTEDELAELVESGQLRYIYNSGRTGGGRSGTNSWISEHCTAVSGFDTQTRNTGTPDGTSGQGNEQISLFDCIPETSGNS